MERIRADVERVLARSGSRQALPLAELTAAWPAVVGDAIARNAWPSRIARDGTLHVATASSTWAHELALFGDEILERLRNRLGDSAPSSLRCAVGPIPEPERVPEVAPRAPAEVPPDVGREAESAAAAIADPEVRDLVARAARASLWRARSGRNF